MDTATQIHKAHRKRVAGGKVKKKEAKDQRQRHNPKAFSFSGGVQAVQHQVQRTLDLQTRRDRIPRIDKLTSLQNPPPLTIVVHGPPKVGKTTLIRSLVKHYTNHSISVVNGPITLVSGKHRRLTIVECGSDIMTMLDLAKVADVVLLMIDGSYGLELETFEFINILQTHGFPRVIGVLTHLDSFKNKTSLRVAKKKLKDRIWAELYNGAKVFYLSGLQYGRYNKMEIHNLARFLAVQKAPILQFRSQHPYIVALRFEDQTAKDDQNDESKPLNVGHFYGYVCGARFRPGSFVHIPGAGDFPIQSITSYEDPCPLPPISRGSQRDGARMLRTLKAHHKGIYAPGCDVGNIRFDQDAMYIYLPNHEVGFTRKEDLLETTTTPLEVEGKTPKIEQIEQDISSSLPEINEEEGFDSDVTMSEEETADESEQDEDEEMMPTDTKCENKEKAEVIPEAVQLIRDLHVVHAPLDRPDRKDKEFKLFQTGRRADDPSRRETFDEVKDEEIVEQASEEEKDDDEDDDEDDEDENLVSFDMPYNENRPEDSLNALSSFNPSISLKSCIYEGPPQNNSKVMEWTKQVLSPVSHFARVESFVGVPSIARVLNLYGVQEDLKTLENLWTEESLEMLKTERFITGGWDGQREEETKENDENNKIDSEEEEGEDSERTVAAVQEKEEAAAEIARKEMLTNEVDEMEDTFVSGTAIGSYVRIVIENLPALWLEEMAKRTSEGCTSRPIILGGILSGENSLAHIQCRLKRHRWAPKILKNQDPLIVSVGWRRFQTVPTYALEDRNSTRHRMLKYTPEHMHCLAILYGPVCPTNSGLLAVRNVGLVSYYRISATGITLDCSASFDIMKKLKLVGEPEKVLKKTAFIKGMFSSDLEVNKCSGAKIQTVSGIRGQIKKAQGTKGSFRATFEDKILISDIVICKTWTRVEPKAFFNPVIDVPGWRKVRTIAELRNAHLVPIPQNESSSYGAKPERVERKFNPLRIPPKLFESLPFDAKMKALEMRKIPDPVSTPPTATPQGPAGADLSVFEQKVNTLIQRLEAIKSDRGRKKTLRESQKAAVRQKREDKANDNRLRKGKENRKKRYAIEGAKEERRRKKLRLA